MKTQLDLANKNTTFSNAGGNQYVTDEEIQASAKLTQQLAANRAAAKQRELETGCHKPFLNVGKKKKAYLKCLQDAAERQAKANQPVIVESPRSSTPPPATEPKFLGMPQTAGIAVVVVGIGVLGFLGYKLLTRNKAQ